ncbi:MAG: Transcriptional regulator [Vezdaea aestivalis]|nr:MAG: Transcriptional regulator [Vezdaea aestivalis]
MPPGSTTSKSKAAAQRRSRSRNSTPGSSVAAGPGFDQASLRETEYLEIPLSKLMVPTNVTYAMILKSYENIDALDRHGNISTVPDARSLEELASHLNTLNQLAVQRGQVCDRGMRDLGKKRKEVAEDERERERERDDREKEERRERMRLAAEEEDSIRHKKHKRSKDSSRSREERPLAVGAHTVTRQDVDMKDAFSSPESKPHIKKASASPGKARRDGRSASVSTVLSSRPVTPGTAPEPSSPTDSSTSHQPPPAAAITQYQVFGPDPSTFDDPTIYNIREVTPDMSEETIKQIYAVTRYPHDDLHDLIPGTPPDKDFSNGKPSTNQVVQTTFSTAVEPYFRPFTEEDIAFLREKGDRSNSFVLPRRAKRSYQDVWAEEDGATSIDSSRRDHLPANQARGSMDQMDDDTASTEKVSMGPLYSRMLSSWFVSDRSASEDKSIGLSNGDVEMTGTNGEVNGTGDTITNGDRSGEVPPATYLAESSQPGWKPSNTKVDALQAEERLKQELEYIGFLAPGGPADYDAGFDDDISERLRLLQERLREQNVLNCTRKGRISELLKERIAYQEYTTIREDLDSQVTQAFQKRNRTLGKSKKQQKRPGGAGGGSHPIGAGGPGTGTSRPGIGDLAKTLMERRQRWISNISPIFDDVQERVPREGETIFNSEVMGPLIQRERDGWEDGDE